MKKRGQIEARIVIYVLAVFIAGVILIYGYTVIKGLVGTQEDILLLTFKEDLKAKVEEKSYEFRSSEKLTFTLPKQFTAVCYGDVRRMANNQFLINQMPTGLTLIKDSFSDSVQNNFFLMERGLVMRDSLFVGDLFIPNNFECVNITDGQLNLQFTAQGRQGVLINGWG
ncbi:hypothetical protein KY325_01395 [Candidatus Woesearchaeota archaeon]|nr:hypothetical protein [Candidatus Woesearchaeota archaeon]MBW3017793.1 hypothetical protein [Candidatus Woesearchaeota archaeon]